MNKFYRKDAKDRRGKWSDVLKSIGIMLVVYLCFRWILWEPFVIPSGSMESTLLVQDYVMVKKWAYGVRIPFTENWVSGPQAPQRGDIVVFKATDETGHFLVKRVVGLPGESIRINEQGHIYIDGVGFDYKLQDSENPDYMVYQEHNGVKSYKVQYLSGISQEPSEFQVPEGHIFMMGDNRNQSSDSRFWGPLPMNRIMGKLVVIWMSCQESESYSSFLCPPNNFRMERIFKLVD